MDNHTRAVMAANVFAASDQTVPTLVRIIEKALREAVGDVVATVDQMRDAQNTYFKMRSLGLDARQALGVAKNREAAVDELVAVYKSGAVQGTMFPEDPR